MSKQLKVQGASLYPTQAADAAGWPRLTPQLLAATGAKYSRSQDGVDAILAGYDPENPGTFESRVFKFLDYGHQSIADMAPVALFIDNISILLAYMVWSVCPTANGQEKSTRYNPLNADGLIDPTLAGINPNHHATWRARQLEAFDAYHAAIAWWEAQLQADPGLAGIPKMELGDKSDRGRAKVTRKLRNYAFDRARVFIPVGALTNMMLVLSARGWCQLTEWLLSHELPEAITLGNAIRGQLQLVIPDLIKHGVSKPNLMARIRHERSTLKPLAEEIAYGGPSASNLPTQLRIVTPPHIGEREIIDELQFHDNRYDRAGSQLCLVSVHWSTVVDFASLRDLNRHRTGGKYCELIPRGFYGASDQWPAGSDTTAMEALCRVGEAASGDTLDNLILDEPAYPYWALLGTQFQFSRNVTADKFVYEAELRTGAGAHYAYARIERELLRLWFQQFPKTKPFIIEGLAEPE